MNRLDFLNAIIEIIEIEENIDENTILSDIEEWDSLAAVTTLALFKQKLGLNVGAQSVLNCKTVKDLLDLGNNKYNG